MKLPGEELEKKISDINTKIKAKQQVLIASGNVSTSNSIQVEIDFSLYDKIILEIDSGAYSEGASYIMEIDEDGVPVNKCINFDNYPTDQFQCRGFFFVSDTNKVTLSTRVLTGWNNRRYYIRGILKN